MVPDSTKAYLRFLRTSYVPKANAFLIIFLLTWVSELSILAIPYLSGRAFDARHTSLMSAYGFAGLMLALLLVRMFFITFVEDWIRITRLDYAIPRDVAHTVLKTLITQGTDKPFKISMRIDAVGVRALCSLTDTMIFKIIPSTTRIVFIGVSMALSSLPLALLFIGSVSIYSAIAWLRHKALNHKQKLQEVELVHVNAIRGDIHEQLSDMAQAWQLLDTWLTQQFNLDKERVTLALQGRVWDRFRNLPLRVGEVAVLGFGIWLESQGLISEGILIACILWSRKGSETATSVGKQIARLEDEWAQIKNLAELLDHNGS